jgi:sigma-B regulation protein RsbU (phosphoserine phosphatase)
MKNISKKNKFKPAIKLRYKFSIPTLFITFIALTVLTIIIFLDQRDSYLMQLENRAKNTIELIAINNSNYVWAIDEDSLNKNIYPFTKDKAITWLKISDDDGNIYYEYELEEVGNYDITLSETMMNFDEPIATVEMRYSSYYVEKNIQRVMQKLIFIGVVTFFLLWFAIWIVSITILKPLRMMNETVIRFSDKDFSARSNVKSKDEIGILAREFNSMASSIQAYSTKMETLVAERTNKLNDALVEIKDLNEKLKAENLRMSAELDVTKRMQQMILPKDEELSECIKYNIAAFMRPADEVGGDYYDIIHENGKVRLSIGDVTGHGLESGVIMLMLQTAIRTLHVCEITDTQRFFKLLNQIIYENITRMNTDKSLTLSMIDVADNKVRLSGQHEDVIVFRKNGDIELIATNDLGMPIGLIESIHEFVNNKILHLEQGDGLILYTDGITEAENMEGEQFGIERFCDLIHDNCMKEAEEIKSIIVKSVLDFIGKNVIYDDITLIVFKQL